MFRIFYILLTSARLSEKISKGSHEVIIKIDTYDLAGSQIKTKIITYSK